MDLRTVRVVSTALEGVALEVRRLEGVEELNRLFRFDVEITIPGAAGPDRIEEGLLQGPVSLVFEEGGAEVTRVHGIVAEISRAGSADLGGTSLSLTIVPRVWTMSQTRRSEIFLGLSVPEILAQKLTAAGFRAREDFVLALHGKYRPREFLAQYNEIADERAAGGPDPGQAEGRGQDRRGAQDQAAERVERAEAENVARARLGL
jgi:type VI secretion system secreted protein VgrG